MVRNEALKQFIDSRYVYRYTHGPHMIRSKEQALRHGINCESLAHLALRELTGITLPPKLRCYEMYHDSEYFRLVDTDEAIQTGDVFWFGSVKKIHPVEFEPVYDGDELINWDDFPVKHIAIYSGERAPNGDPLLLHSTPITGTNSIWPLTRFRYHCSSKRLYGISRLLTIDDANNLQQSPRQENHAFPSVDSRTVARESQQDVATVERANRHLLRAVEQACSAHQLAEPTKHL